MRHLPQNGINHQFKTSIYFYQNAQISDNREKDGIGFSWINVAHRMYSSRKNHILSRGWEQVRLLTIDQNQSFVGEPSLAEVLQAGSDKLPRKPLES